MVVQLRRECEQLAPYELQVFVYIKSEFGDLVKGGLVHKNVVLVVTCNLLSTNLNILFADLHLLKQDVLLVQTQIESLRHFFLLVSVLFGFVSYHQLQLANSVFQVAKHRTAHLVFRVENCLFQQVRCALQRVNSIFKL